MKNMLQLLFIGLFLIGFDASSQAVYSNKDRQWAHYPTGLTYGYEQNTGTLYPQYAIKALYDTAGRPLSYSYIWRDSNLVVGKDSSVYNLQGSRIQQIKYVSSDTLGHFNHIVKWEEVFWQYDLSNRLTQSQYVSHTQRPYGPGDSASIYVYTYADTAALVPNHRYELGRGLPSGLHPLLSEMDSLEFYPNPDLARWDAIDAFVTFNGLKKGRLRNYVDTNAPTRPAIFQYIRERTGNIDKLIQRRFKPGVGYVVDDSSGGRFTETYDNFGCLLTYGMEYSSADGSYHFIQADSFDLSYNTSGQVIAMTRRTYIDPGILFSKDRVEFYAPTKTHKQLPDKPFRAYLNNHELTLRLPELSAKGRLRIITSDGKEVYASDAPSGFSKQNIPNIAPGIYILQITDGAANWNIKLPIDLP